MTYLLRAIPDRLWPRVKRRAQSEGRTIRGAILALLTWYADHGLPEARSSDE